MTQEKNELAVIRETSFQTVLDGACNALQDKQTRYSLRKLEEFDELLGDMERELDNFIDDGQDTEDAE
jgi:hypothetical protein